MISESKAIKTCFPAAVKKVGMPQLAVCTIVPESGRVGEGQGGKHVSY
jgi:hypothetical protein